jgi:hypothetical protein
MSTCAGNSMLTTEIISVCNTATANRCEGFAFFFGMQISRSSANCSLRRGLLSDVSSVYLSYAFRKRSLMRESNGKAFVRGGHEFLQYAGDTFLCFAMPIYSAEILVCFSTVWKVMEMCYKILGEGKLVHQRELFYKLLSDSPNYFSCQHHVNRAIQGQHNSPTLYCFLLDQRVPRS